MSELKCGFIGCGNMGGAVCRAVSKVIDPAAIAVTGKSAVNADALKDELGVISTDQYDIAEHCEYIFLAVKPQVFFKVLDEIKPSLESRKDRFVIISMAAGITLDRISEALGYPVPVIRMLPNTPVAVGSGVIVYKANSEVTGAEKKFFEEIMKFSGLMNELDEKLIDAACSVAGCGPAFVYMFMNALADGGVNCGLSRQDALLFAAQTLKGSAELYLSTKEHPMKLKDNVCSPGGSTIEGVLELENKGFSDAVASAVCASFKKNVELGKK